MAASELPSGVVCAAIFLGDPVSPLVAAGVAVILAGIVLSQAGALKHKG
jgi:drug/metabolite transporter (DMT)-like permease